MEKYVSDSMHPRRLRYGETSYSQMSPRKKVPKKAPKRNVGRKRNKQKGPLSKEEFTLITDLLSEGLPIREIQQRTKRSRALIIQIKTNRHPRFRNADVDPRPRPIHRDRPPPLPPDDEVSKLELTEPEVIYERCKKCGAKSVLSVDKECWACYIKDLVGSNVESDFNPTVPHPGLPKDP